MGRLLYLSFTRPDLAYSVHVLSQFMQKPQEEHWEATLFVDRYIKSNPSQRIVLSSSCDLHLRGWCDADWGQCQLSRQSLMGWFVQLGTSPISWRTKKQDRVSRSFAEAKYWAMATTTCELLRIKGILVDLAYFMHNLWHCIVTIRPPFIYSRTRCFMTKQSMSKLTVTISMMRYSMVLSSLSLFPHVQFADTFTKVLSKQEFDNFVHELGIHNLHVPAWGVLRNQVWYKVLGKNSCLC